MKDSSSDLAPPPRVVPWPVRATALFAGEIGAPGWVLLGIATFFIFSYISWPFIALGAGLVLAALWRGMKANYLLANGVLGLGTLKSKKVIKHDSSGDPSVWKLTFEFIANDGRTHDVSTSTTEPGKLEDQEYEGLLYDPRRPSRAVMMDTLPGAPKIDGAGHITVGNRAHAVFARIGPPAVLFVPGVHLLIRYGL